MLYEILSKEFLKAVSQDEFVKLCRRSSRNIRKIQQGMICLMPFLELYDHSFAPNLQISGLYFSHRRQSFLRILTTRVVEAGERLTFNYGDESNY